MIEVQPCRQQTENMVWYQRLLVVILVLHLVTLPRPVLLLCHHLTDEPNCQIDDRRNAVHKAAYHQRHFLHLGQNHALLQDLICQPFHLTTRLILDLVGLMDLL